MFQLDTWFRPKKSGRGGGVRSGTGLNTVPRPNSGDDFDEIEQQRSIIERMDEEAMNDRFEKMLVRIIVIWSLILIARIITNLVGSNDGTITKRYFVLTCCRHLSSRVKYCNYIINSEL